MNGGDGDDDDVDDDDVDDDDVNDVLQKPTKNMQYINFLWVYFVYQDIPLNHQYHQRSNTTIALYLIQYLTFVQVPW